MSKRSWQKIRMQYIFLAEKVFRGVYISFTFQHWVVQNNAHRNYCSYVLIIKHKGIIWGSLRSLCSPCSPKTLRNYLMFKHFWEYASFFFLWKYNLYHNNLNNIVLKWIISQPSRWLLLWFWSGALWQLVDKIYQH